MSALVPYTKEYNDFVYTDYEGRICLVDECPCDSCNKHLIHDAKRRLYIGEVPAYILEQYPEEANYVYPTFAALFADLTEVSRKTLEGINGIYSYADGGTYATLVDFLEDFDNLEHDTAYYITETSSYYKINTVVDKAYGELSDMVGEELQRGKVLNIATYSDSTHPLYVCRDVANVYSTRAGMESDYLNQINMTYYAYIDDDILYYVQYVGIVDGAPVYSSSDTLLLPYSAPLYSVINSTNYFTVFVSPGLYEEDISNIERNANLLEVSFISMDIDNTIIDGNIDGYIDSTLYPIYFNTRFFNFSFVSNSSYKFHAIFCKCVFDIDLVGSGVFEDIHLRDSYKSYGSFKSENGDSSHIDGGRIDLRMMDGGDEPGTSIITGDGYNNQSGNGGDGGAVYIITINGSVDVPVFSSISITTGNGGNGDSGGSSGSATLYDTDTKDSLTVITGDGGHGSVGKGGVGGAVTIEAEAEIGEISLGNGGDSGPGIDGADATERIELHLKCLTNSSTFTVNTGRGGNGGDGLSTDTSLPLRGGNGGIGVDFYQDLIMEGDGHLVINAPDTVGLAGANGTSTLSDHHGCSAANHGSLFGNSLGIKLSSAIATVEINTPNTLPDGLDGDVGVGVVDGGGARGGSGGGGGSITRIETEGIFNGCFSIEGYNSNIFIDEDNITLNLGSIGNGGDGKDGLDGPRGRNADEYPYPDDYPEEGGPGGHAGHGGDGGAGLGFYISRYSSIHAPLGYIQPASFGISGIPGNGGNGGKGGDGKNVGDMFARDGGRGGNGGWCGLSINPVTGGTGGTGGIGGTNPSETGWDALPGVGGYGGNGSYCSLAVGEGGDGGLGGDGGTDSKGRVEYKGIGGDGGSGYIGGNGGYPGGSGGGGFIGGNGANGENGPISVYPQGGYNGKDGGMGGGCDPNDNILEYMGWDSIVAQCGNGGDGGDGGNGGDGGYPGGDGGRGGMGGVAYGDVPYVCGDGGNGGDGGDGSFDDNNVQSSGGIGGDAGCSSTTYGGPNGTVGANGLPGTGGELNGDDGDAC